MTAAKFHRAQVGEMLKELYAATALKSLTLYGNPSVGKFIPSTPSTKGLRLLCHMHSSNHRFRRTSATGVSSTVPSWPMLSPLAHTGSTTITRSPGASCACRRRSFFVAKAMRNRSGNRFPGFVSDFSDFPVI